MVSKLQLHVVKFLAIWDSSHIIHRIHVGTIVSRYLTNTLRYKDVHYAYSVIVCFDCQAIR